MSGTLRGWETDCGFQHRPRRGSQGAGQCARPPIHRTSWLQTISISPTTPCLSRSRRRRRSAGTHYKAWLAWLTLSGPEMPPSKVGQAGPLSDLGPPHTDQPDTQLVTGDTVSVEVVTHNTRRGLRSRTARTSPCSTAHGHLKCLVPDSWGRTDTAVTLEAAGTGRAPELSSVRADAR